ncbi:MAG: AAA family ATPase [Rickettsiales bacterium]
MLNLNTIVDNNFPINVSTDEIRNRLLVQMEDVLRHLLPNGKRRHHQYHVGNIQGEPGESLKVELRSPKAGMWHDFATGDKGDIFTLWAKVRGLDAKDDFPRLMEEIKNWLGVYTPFQSPMKSSSSPANKNANNDNLGKPTSEWSYTDIHGKVIAKKLRYDVNGEKSYLPWDEERKEYKMPKSRPLYNLPGITKSNKVILVEGEKCAQALIDKDLCATTAMGGANASINKTDWSPLKGKDIIIWPDNDTPGKEYAEKAYHFLQQMEVASVKLIDISTDKIDKWDAADAVVEGMDVKAFIEQAKFVDMADKLPISSSANDNNYIERIYDTDLMDLPPPIEWIIPDWMPKGEVGAIYGDGGQGKSTLVQQLMTALATGKDWLGFKREPIKVYGILCEDKKDQFHRRQYRINQKLGVSYAEVKGNMVLIPRKGKDNILMRFNRDDQAKLTEFFDNLLIDIKKFQPQLVILDTLADIFGGNEIIRAQARQFIQSCCGKIAEETGATVLLCAHPSEAGLNKKSGTGGSTAWHNTLRFRWFIETPEGMEFTPDMRTLTLKKSNYSPCDGKFTLKLERDGIFTVVEDLKILSAAAKHFNKLEDTRDAKSNYILNLIMAEASREIVYTMRSFSGKFQNTGIPNLGSKRAIQDRLEDLTLKGYIKFFQNAEEYGLPKLLKGNYGYMCTNNMRLKVKGKGNLVIQPTHCRCQISGGIKEINGSQ